MNVPDPANGALPSRRSANERWKNAWSRWVLASTVVGAAAHLVVFNVFPAWEIHAERIFRGAEFTQINPLVAAGAEMSSGEEAVAAVPDLENVELEVRAGGEGGLEASIEALIEMFGALTGPSVARPIEPRAEFGNPQRPLPPLTLDEVIALSPRMTTTITTVTLPMIRNPVSLQRFLRTRYNPVHDAATGGGSVSVAMWVNERGDVEWTAVERSSGFAAVDEIALTAFTDVVSFSPARYDGKRVPVSVVITVPFTAPW
jgi:TonB family protein